MSEATGIPSLLTLRAGRRLRLGVILLGSLVTALQVRSEQPIELFRLGFSHSTLAGVNENDARASLRAIAAAISRNHGIAANPEPLLFKGLDGLVSAVQAREIHAVSLATDEYWALGPRVSFSRYILAGQGTDPNEEYVVLVRHDSAAKSLAELHGKRLAIHSNPRMRLGTLWLEVQLARLGQSPAAAFFSRAVKSPKLSKVVLDVFFKQADACLVTRRGFEAMAELNPQVGRQLTRLAISSPMVPGLFAFCAGLPSDYEQRVVREFLATQHTTAGRQALTIFQVGDLAEHPASALASALKLLDEYRQLRPDDAARHVARLARSIAEPMEDDVR